MPHDFHAGACRRCGLSYVEQSTDLCPDEDTQEALAREGIPSQQGVFPDLQIRALPWRQVDENDLPSLGVPVFVVLDYDYRTVATRHRIQCDRSESCGWRWNEGTSKERVTHWCKKEDLLP